MDIEEKKKTYNKIVRYYDFADELIEKIQDVDERNIEDKIVILEPMIKKLESVADKLTEQYIEYIKTDDGSESAEEIRLELNNLIAKIDHCKDCVYKLYSKES